MVSSFKFGGIQARVDIWFQLSRLGPLY